MLANLYNSSVATFNIKFANPSSNIVANYAWNLIEALLRTPVRREKNVPKVSF